MLEKGQTIPQFSMFTSDKEVINNETIKGKKALILFIPAAFTSVCTKEFCAVRDDISRYNDYNATVIGISTDSLFVLAHWKKEQAINFTLASDYNKDVSSAFGVNYDTFAFGMKGTAKRSAFVVDENGIILHAEVLENAGDMPDFDKIHAALNLA
jgi:peroxiredoxin